MELGQWVDDTLYPEIWSRVNEVFPDMGFTFSLGKWKSSKRLDGSSSNRRDKIVITSTQYTSVLENGSGDTFGKRGKNLISWYMERNNITDRIEAIRKISEKLGLKIPEGKNAEEWEKKRLREEKLALSHDRQVKALDTPEGAQVLDYLINVRKYSRQLIKDMGIGYLSPGEAQTLNQGENLVVWKPEDYPLSIPYYSRGKIIGFKCRCITDEALHRNGDQKYMNTKGLSKKENPFGLTPNSLSMGINRKGEVVVVEGELDALHAIALGLPNVIAVAGGDVGEETARTLKKNGYKNIVILMDSDGAGQKFTASSIRRIDEAGLNSFVGTLTDAKDLDGFLVNHSIDELQEVIKGATFGTLYLFFDECRRFDNTDKSPLEFQNFLDRYVELASSTSDPIKRERLFSYLIELGEKKDIEIDIASIQKGIKEKVEQRKLEEDRKRSRNDALASLRSAASLLSGGKGTEALETAETALETLRVSEAEDTIQNSLEDNTDELWESYKSSPKALKTKFELFHEEGRNNELQPYSLSFPSGAVSVVGAPTNHGKSKILQSIALDALEETEEGEMLLYVTYEENEANVNKQFLNAYADIELTDPRGKGSNIKTITEYLTEGKTTYMKNISTFKQKEKEWKDIRRSRRIKIVKPDDSYLGTLQALLGQAMRQKDIRVKAIFIDYIQEIYVKDWTKYSRTDELKQAMVTLDETAQRSGIPIIVAAQLNRDVLSPLYLYNQYIADSGWIERKASEIVLIWSNKEKCKKDPKGDEKVRVADDIESRLGNLNLGEGGKLYFKLTKSRVIPSGSDAIIPIDGNTGRVHSNITKREPQQTSFIVIGEEEPDTPQQPQQQNQKPVEGNSKPFEWREEEPYQEEPDGDKPLPF